MNMIKVMSCRFDKCLGRFTMLLVEGSSKTELFRHLSNHVFEVINFGNTKAMWVIFFSKTFKLSDRFRKWSQKVIKNFCFWDNWIWIAIVTLSLLRTGYFSPVAIGLPSKPKILHVNKTYFFRRNFLGSDGRIW